MLCSEHHNVQTNLHLSSASTSFDSWSLARLSQELTPMFMQSISIVPVVGSVADCCMATCMQPKILTSSSLCPRHVASLMHMIC
jgi:hypothetical protein